jgi:hypothetical protein
LLMDKDAYPHKYNFLSRIIETPITTV